MSALPLKTLTRGERAEAFSAGFNANRNGRSRELAENAYSSPAMRREWRRGWDRAQKGLGIQLPQPLKRDEC